MMYYEEGLTQREIAQRLSISRSNISRLLTEARDEGIVEIKVKKPILVSSDLRKALLKRFSLHEALVLITGHRDFQESLEGLGRLAAEYLENTLKDDSILGISWGTAVYETVKALRPIAKPGVQVVQMIGGMGTINPKIDGILVQLPLPEHIDTDKVIMHIIPEKDVDGFHPQSIGKMIMGKDTFLPCTPHGIIKLLLHSDVKVEGANVVVVGRSNIVGKPVANLLLSKSEGGNATVTVCHSRTKNIAEITRRADILIAAIGKPEFITADMIKDGAVVIDVGVNRVDDSTKKRGYRLVGDVEYKAALEKASKITPVPGGVGPMTITMLMYNTVNSAKNRK